MYQPDNEQALAETAGQLLDNTISVSDNERALLLRQVINYADWKYYVQDNPILADAEYDALFRQLKDIEAQHPELMSADSPTQRVAYGISEQFSTEPHLVPMLSLENSYNANDLIEWDRRCRDTLKIEKIEYTVEPKYDGAGISLLYEDNLMVRGLTRGDGVKGENITPNIRQIRSIPLAAAFLSEHIQSIEVRGEVLIHKKVFAKYNEQRVAEGLPPLANPRNAASGSLRMLDAREVARRGLNAVLYHVSYHNTTPGVAEPAVLATHYDTLQLLYNLGFNTPVREMKKCMGIDDVIQHCKAFEQHRDDLPFEIDGMVVKVNSIRLQEQLGMTTHHPRWAIAFKFKARQATAKLLHVDFQVGRTGIITPVAKIEPVAIGGVTVSSISLFNEDVVREKDLLIGDMVLVERAGDVIPYIVKSLPELRKGAEQPIRFPHTCPVCEEPLFKPEGEVAWRCINVACPAQVAERIIHYASKDAMDIRNLGDANIRRFYQLGLLSDITGIYKLDFEKVRQLEKFGEKSVMRLQQSIEQSLHQPLNRLIYALGIRYVGKTTAKTLAGAITHIKDLMNWDEARLCTLEDIGPKVAASVHQFFQTPENVHILDELERLGVKVINTHTHDAEHTGGLSGTSFLFTGTLSQMKRSDAEAMVESLGGKISSSVSSKLNYLVVGADAGSKLEKAKKIGTVKILTEDEFVKMIAGK